MTAQLDLFAEIPKRTRGIVWDTDRAGFWFRGVFQFTSVWVYMTDDIPGTRYTGNNLLAIYEVPGDADPEEALKLILSGQATVKWTKRQKEAS